MLNTPTPQATTKSTAFRKTKLPLVLCRATTFTVSALFAILGLTQSALSADSEIITTEEMTRKGLIPFNGKLTAVDLSAKMFTVEITGDWLQRSKRGKQCDIYVTESTKITNGGKPATLKSGRIGGEVGGIAKNANGKSIAVSVGFNPSSPKSLYPYAIPVKGRPGFVISPYALKAAPLDVSDRRKGDEVRDPYTKKIFLVP